MKKVLTFILSFVLMISTISVVTTADAVVYGDVNTDGAINNRDYALLMQYINKWPVAIDFANSDVYVDNVINNRDYSLLMQYINKWDVELGVVDDGLINDGVDPEFYRGTSVVMTTTVLSQFDESGPVIDRFEKEHGIQVNEILVFDNVYEIAGLIASGINVDVVRCNGAFPAIISVLWPLTKAKLDYEEPIWDQNMFDMTTFDGEPYLCNTVGNIWAENACVIYSKNLLARANCYTPEEYDAVGKWTWDAFAAIANAVDNIDGLGTGIRGCYYSVEDMLGSVGCRLYDFDNGVFSNGLNNSMQSKAFTKMAEWYKDGFVTSYYDNQFNGGKVGICTGNAWSLKKNGSNSNYDWNDIGFYRMPDFEEGYTANHTGMLRGWGIARASNNPVGAGIFLRYYLDVENYDTSSAFISAEAENFFFDMTDVDYDNYTPYFTYGDTTQDLTGFYEYEWEKIATGNPNFTAHSLSNISSSVDKACDILNSFISKNT